MILAFLLYVAFVVWALFSGAAIVIRAIARAIRWAITVRENRASR